MRKDTAPHNRKCGKFTGHYTCGARAVHRAVTGVFFFEKLWRDPLFDFFSQKKMTESLVSRVKRVKYDDKNDKRVLSI